MDFKFQINNNNQSQPVITLDEYVPLQIKIESSTPSSSALLHIFFRDQKNLTELKIGANFGELYSVTVIFSNHWVFYEYFFNDSKYLKWYMSSYFIFKYKAQADALISSVDIANPCTVEVFLDVILIILPSSGKGQFIFYQSSNFGVITDNELNVIGFLLKNILPENRKTLLDLANNLLN